jgi:drug/metabolite transporter (DMT)-like permease
MTSPSAPATGSTTTAAVPGAGAPMRPWDWLLLCLPGLLWGTSFYFIAEGLEAFPAALITPMRVGIGFAVLAAFPAARRSVPRADWGRIALLGVVWMAFPLTMFPYAEQHVSSSVTGMLNGATPLFVAAVASIIAHRLPPRMQMLGLLVGSLGVVLIALPTLGEGRSSAVGVVQILAALSCYGIALNLAVPLQQRHGALPVLWRSQAVALTLTLPFGLTHLDEIEFAWGPLFAVIALGVLGTSFAYVLAATNAGRLGSTRASVTTYIIPVVSLLLGALIRDEAVAALAVVGCSVALFGAWLAGRRG